MEPLTDLGRLSLNQMTTEPWDVRAAVEGCARAGIPYIGLWRHKVAETGLHASARIVRDAGLKVSSLCRGGMFPAATAAERRDRIDDNRRAIDECVALGTDTLVLVCGPAPGRDIDAAREMVADGIEQLIPYAADQGVRLAIEPLHPMFAVDRSVIVTLGQANDFVERFASPQVGVIVDVYHVWWDPHGVPRDRTSAGAYPGLSRQRLVGRHARHSERARHDGRRQDRATPLPCGCRGQRLRWTNRGRNLQQIVVGDAG